MLRKMLIWAGLTASFLFSSAFTTQDASGSGLTAGWSALIVVFVIIFIVAILLIFQGHNTPDAVSRYHLDHGNHEHASSHAAETVEMVAPVVAAAATSDDSGRAGAIPATEDIFRTTVDPDDLTRIEGIGPKINQLLNDGGIYTYRQLSDSDPAHLKSILTNAGPRFSLADPITWPEQASYLAAGDEEQFKTLVDRLRSGRQR